MIKDMSLTTEFDKLYQKPVYLIGQESYVQIAQKILFQFGIESSSTVLWDEGMVQVPFEEEFHKDDVTVLVATEHKDYEKVISLLHANAEEEEKIYTFVGLLYASYFHMDKAKTDVLKKTFDIWLYNQHLQLNLRQSSVGMYPLLLEDKDSTPIIIFQPGKVASNTVERSLKECGTRVFRAHGIEYASECCKEVANVKETVVDCIKSFKKVKMITLVREPIAKDIGHFFQKLAIVERDAGWFIKGMMEDDFQQSFLNYLSVVSPFDFTKEGKKEELVSKLICHIDYIGQKNEKGAMWGWFEEEFKNNFGLDVLAEPFDQEKGYSIIEKDNIELLIIKMEKLNDLESVLQEFTGNKNFKLVSVNKGDEKSYKYIYKQFQKEVQLPQEYVDYYYKDNVYTNHFYSEEERRKFEEKWEKHIG